MTCMRCNIMFGPTFNNRSPNIMIFCIITHISIIYLVPKIEIKKRTHKDKIGNI
jgi:hypothetical protein